MFNLTVVVSLFAVENLWLLPKNDFIKVLLELVALLTLASVEHFSMQEYRDQLKVVKSRTKRAKVAQDKTKLQRRLILALLAITCYIYVDASDATPLTHLKLLLQGLPVPGK